MREIPLAKGKAAIVDDADYERLGIHHWSCSKAGYAMRGFRENGKMVYLKMHHAILGKPPRGFVVDHIKEMPPNNLRKPVAKFTDFIRFTLNKMRRLFSGSS